MKSFLFASSFALYTASALCRPAMDDFSSSLMKVFGKDAKCDALTLPSSSLPAPSDGTYLDLIVVGRGTQNYTCAGLQPTDAPVAKGAVASLYNVTCFSPPLSRRRFDDLPKQALTRKWTLQNGIDVPMAQLDLSGNHYFSALAPAPTPATPTFNLNVGKKQDGIFFGKKLAAANAPEDPLVNVPWLKLSNAGGSTNGLYEAYRVETAGGQPAPHVDPTTKAQSAGTCADQKVKDGPFTVEYAAQYWFYVKP